jgi:50S ribosomal protein L16 3-hydroxylase
MFDNSKIGNNEFLQHYYQKKPLLFKNAFSLQHLKDFPSANELAGLSLDGVSSRIITGNYTQHNWQLTTSPFAEHIFTTLPKNNWTLLVQGVDRFIPKVYDFIDNFNIIPRWKFDDVLMSYASIGGSVGPHFDYYDVFLLQTSGSRRWRLSTKHCDDENYNSDFSLKIMQQFESEMDIVAEAGDVLYIPPKVAHFGESLSDDCTTASFGYRSYHAGELADYANKTIKQPSYYKDPVWHTQPPALIPKQAVEQANILTSITTKEFAEFVTQTDLIDEEILQYGEQYTFDSNLYYQLHPAITIAYTTDKRVFIAGMEYTYPQHQQDSIINFCNTRTIHGTHTLTKELFNLGYIIPS